MTDEDKKRIVSEPPPPTDEIDGEWGEDDQTLIRDIPEGLSKSQPAPAPAAAAARSSAPPQAAEASTPPEMKAAAPVVDSDDEEDEEDEEDEQEEDETPSANEDDQADEEDEDDEDEEDEEELSPAISAPAATDWLPNWAPYAVLAGLVGVSIVFGLGLVGGPPAPSEENDKAEPAASAAKAPALKAPAKPSGHP